VRHEAFAVEPPQASITSGQRTLNSGTVAATASTKKANIADGAPSGGNETQRPNQDSARNKPTAVAIEASAGHSCSQNRPAGQRPSARREQGCSRVNIALVNGSSVFGSLKTAPERRICQYQHFSTRLIGQKPSKTQASLTAKVGAYPD